MEEQKKTTGLREVTKELIGWEDKILLTISHLTTQPGQVIAKFCKGDKNEYLSPAAYFFGVTALNATLFTVTGLFDHLVDVKQNPIALKLGMDLSSLPNEFNSLLSFLLGEIGQKTVLLPIVLLLTWVIYKRYNQSFKESSWFVLYASGHSTLLATSTILYWYITKDTNSLPIMRTTIELTYLIWASKQFYNIKVGKAIFLQIVLRITFLLTLAIIGLFAGLTYELFKS